MVIWAPHWQAHPGKDLQPLPSWRRPCGRPFAATLAPFGGRSAERRSSAGTADGPSLLEAGSAVKVLQKVEERRLLALEGHRGVVAPRLHRRSRHARGQHRPPEAVLRQRHAEPVRALSERLEGAGGGMDTVVARVRLSLEAQALPIGVDQVAHGTEVGGGGVGGAQDLVSELRPRELPWGPLHRVVVDAGARGRELRAHVHVEAVNDEDAVDLAAVEAPTKLQERGALLERAPLCAEVAGADAELLRPVHRVEHEALLQSILPLHAEGLLELALRLRRYVQGVRPLLDGLCGNGAVVCVDELLRVNLLCGDVALRQNGDVCCLEFQLHEILDLVAHSVRLDEDEGRVGLSGLVDLELRHALFQIGNRAGGRHRCGRRCRCGCSGGLGSSLGSGRRRGCCWRGACRLLLGLLDLLRRGPHDAIVRSNWVGQVLRLLGQEEWRSPRGKGVLQVRVPI
mmetsp:Transcript_66309/g.176628  ORF Transcript_66309/g.176628 Transcript_66309/m.176628 type:complete len:456 (-) Transcript_66309:128-1495(-)